LNGKRVRLKQKIPGTTYQGWVEVGGGLDSERDLNLLNKGIYVVRIKNEKLDNLNSVILFLNGIIINRKRQIIDNKQNSSPTLIV
jgi:hypothetical protein